MLTQNVSAISDILYTISTFLDIYSTNCAFRFQTTKNTFIIRGLKIDNSSFEREEEFKYLGKTSTNQNSIQEEIKSRLQSGGAFYHSVKNLLSSSLLHKNLKIEIYRTIILPVVLYGCETWSLILREERRLRVFENRLFRRTFGPKRDEVTG